MRRSLRLFAGLAILFAPTPVMAGEESPEDYRLTIDLGPSIRLLGSDEPSVREPAEELLSVLDDRALPALTAALGTEGEKVRLGVVDVLTSIDGSRATALLLERAKADPSIDVQAAAISGLILRVDPEAEKVVPSALESDDPRFYRTAFEGCARYCTSEKQLDRIVAFVFSEPVQVMGGPRGALLRGAATPSSRNDVVAAVERGAAGRLDDPNPEMRVRAAMLFADLGDARAVEPLSSALGNDMPVMLRLQAIVALGTLGNEQSAAEIGAALGELPPGLRKGGCKALSMMADRQVPGAKAEATKGKCPGLA